MGKVVSVTCPRCGGSGKEDSGYYDDRGYPIEKFCSRCYGSGDINYYVDDDGYYTEM